MDENPELTNLTSKPDILRIIECPVCHEVPFPPIFQCIAGHNICKLCKPKLKKCPICQRLISDTRNYTVEKMVLASTHSCAFKDEGCQIEGTGEMLGDHIKTCRYRSFKCGWNRTSTNCDGHSIKLSHAREHFLATHRAVKTDSKSTLVMAFTSLCKNHSKLKQDIAWCPSLIELDGKAFLGEVYTHKEFVYWTFFCLGTEEDAGKYTVEIIFSSSKNNSAKFQWIVPVQPIIKCEELRFGNEMKDEIVPSCRFNDLIKVAERDDRNSQYVFHTEYKISKRE